MDNRRLDELGSTEFGGTPGGNTNAWFTPTGKLGQWFSKVFATKAKPYIAQQGNPGPTPLAPLAGDTVTNPNTIVAHGANAGPSYLRSPLIPELELNRKKRYQQFEQMDEYPEIGAAFDIYADDSTQEDIKEEKWIVKSESNIVIDEVKRLFTTLKLDREYWDIIRNTVKYGDCFIEVVVDTNRPELGIQRLKILNPSYIYRVENEYGYLTDFLQEIPDKSIGDWSAFGDQSYSMAKNKFISLDKNQIVHFRLHTTDPKFYPYGKSIAALAIRVFRSLKLMEDAMLVYRLSRAPERRVFYINTGQLPTAKAELFVENLKRKFKKDKFYNTATGNIDERFNPLSFDEDFFVPHRGDKETKIEVLPGAQNLGEVDDVKYFRDKLLACLKIPKDYVVEKDKSPERKANLAQLDVKFARTILRIQASVEVGLETIARRHLEIKGYPHQLINELRIKLPDPSDMFTKRKLDIDGQKAQVVQQVIGLGLFSRNHVYKEYYNMTDSEIEQMIDELKKDMETGMTLGQQPGMGAPGMPGMEGPGGAGPNSEMPMDQQQQPNNNGEARENMPPTKEEVFTLMKGKILQEELTTNRLKTLKRIKEKYINMENPKVS